MNGALSTAVVRRRPGGVRVTATWLLLGAFAMPAVTLLGPALVGHRSFTIMSGSMSPSISPGDVVVTAPIPAREAEVGDVLTFRDPEVAGRLLTHRVVALRARDGVVEVSTRGDANAAAEDWTIPADGRVGRLVAVVRGAGYLAHPAGTPIGRVLLISVPALLLAAGMLRWALRPSDGSAAGPTATRPPLPSAEGAHAGG